MDKRGTETLDTVDKRSTETSLDTADKRSTERDLTVDKRSMEIDH
jgi:hypothetical protein